MEENMSGMISEPESYFRQFIPERDNFLKELEAEAKDQDIPIIGPLVAKLLYILARATKAVSILELGTATGYSGIYLARAAAENGGRLVTIEWSTEMAERARKNFQKAGVLDVVDIMIGDAQAIIETLKGPFDFVFLDIDKEFYVKILSCLYDVMKKRGLMVADNVGFKDADAFNHAIAGSSQWKCVNLFAFLPGHSPEKDGLCIALAQD
jgi:predicted O-methyltransferase YrrM